MINIKNIILYNFWTNIKNNNFQYFEIYLISCWNWTTNWCRYWYFIYLFNKSNILLGVRLYCWYYWYTFSHLGNIKLKFSEGHKYLISSFSEVKYTIQHTTFQYYEHKYYHQIHHLGSVMWNKMCISEMLIHKKLNERLIHGIYNRIL